MEKKKKKNRYSKKLIQQFCLFKNLKDFSIPIYNLKLEPNGIFNNWKYNSKFFLKTNSFSNCNIFRCFNNFFCSKYKVKKKFTSEVIRFSPRFLSLNLKLIKLLLFTIIYKKTDSNYKKRSSRDSKNRTQIFIQDDIFLIEKLTNKLTNMKLLAKIERFGLVKFSKKDLNNDFLSFCSTEFDILALSKLNTFNQISKFVFSHPFSLI